ncbi:MAG: SpoIIE family protein phosphatase [Marinilabiliaceae bacterium]|nr:SpoIIE family protein phosphatase [Marinilabiliaceae bacterium]
MVRNSISRLLLSLIILWAGMQTSAQVNEKGLPVITGYDYSLTGGGQWNYKIIKDDRGILYFGNDRNILEFDGVKWNVIPVPGDPTIFSLEKDPEGIIYAGASYQFGYLDPDPSGQLKYVSLSSRLDSSIINRLGDIWNIKYFDGRVYFVTKATVFTYDIALDRLDSLKAPDMFYTFQEIYSLNNRLYISDNRLGLTRVEGDTLLLLPGADNFGMDYCMSVLPYDSLNLLVGGYFRGIQLYNPETGYVSAFTSEENNDLLKSHNIYCSIILPDGKIAYGTTSGGIFIFNIKGELEKIINNNTAPLNDDQVYDLYINTVNNDPLVWFSTVGSINKLAYNLPFTSFGRSNNIMSITRDLRRFNNSLYLGGDKGVLKKKIVDGNVLFEEVPGTVDQVHSLVVFKSGTEEYLLSAGLEGIRIIDKNDKVSNLWEVIVKGDKGYNPDYTRKIERSPFNKDIIYAGLERKIRVIRYEDGKWYHLGDLRGDIQGKVHAIVEASPGKLWVSTFDQDKLYIVDITSTDTLVSEYSGKELENVVVNNVRHIAGEVFITSDRGIFKFNSEDSLFVKQNWLMFEDKDGIIYRDILPAGEYGYLVVATDYQDFDYLVANDGSRIMEPFLLMPKSYTSGILYDNNEIWLPKGQQLFVVDMERIAGFKTSNEVLVRTVKIGSDSLIFGGAFYNVDENGKKEIVKHQPEWMIPGINHSYNDITFTWGSSNMIQEDSTLYSFMIENFDEDWSKWDKVYYKDYTNLPHGKYRFKIRARDVSRNISETTVYEFEILRAWYQSLVALFIYAVLIVLFIILIIKVYTRRLIKENLRLEGIVAERTREVVKQKDELEASIHYASRIQRAILPSERSLKGKVDDYFILFRPRDIVSGDFYWVSEKGQKLFIVASDCTGHGVPGAFMSILGISFLDEIINKTGNTNTDEILNQLRTHVTESLKQLEGGDEETKDGMDMGILVINYSNEQIEFSGAYNPCWVVRELTKEEKQRYTKGTLELDRGSLCNGQHVLDTIDADRMPIGVSSQMANSFTMHRKKLEKGETYYLLTDGYSDQFGGERGRKFLKKNLKKLILEIQGVPMKQQKELLEKSLVDWMGTNDQVDDILIMGIKVI